MMIPSSARALVVEDDRSWQQILSELLADAGLAVDLADSLDTAVDALRRAPHRLAVVDLSLGGSDHRDRAGLAVLDALRQHDPGCVSLLLTGFATVELAVSALTEHGAYTCLRKENFRRSQFRELIRRALGPAGPAAPAAPGGAQVAGARPAPDAETGSGATAGLALVVEDDPSWRDILAELLAEAGYRVQPCRSYGEALGCLRREHFQVAVVDLSLASSIAPGSNLDGYRLLATTRANGVPTLVVSGVASPHDIERAYAEQGIFACLEKQAFDRRTFLSTVAQAVAAGAAPGELAALTDREREVLGLLARGLTNKDIAEALVITPNTVKRHLKAIFEKLGVHTRSAAAAKAISNGMPGQASSVEEELGL